MTSPSLEGAQGQVESRLSKLRDQLENKGKITRVDKEKNSRRKAHSFHRASCKGPS